MKPHSLTRRHLLIVAAATGLPARGQLTCDAKGLLTPYKLNKLILAGSGNGGEFDSQSADCPFVFQHERRFYMTYVGFDGIGYQTGLASSGDLITWKKEGCIVPRDPTSPITKYNVAMNWIMRENKLHSPGRLTTVGGEYIGAYHAYPNAGYESGAAVIGLCRSKDLRHWKLDPPCLTPDQGADWERGGLYKPCLLKYEGTFYLFYNAKDHTTGSWNEQTGVATSPDLKTWTRYARNPVIRNGPAGAPDSWFASDPCVLKNGREWAMFYFGRDKTGCRELVATSPDLFHANKCNEILIDMGPPGSVDSSFAHKPSLVAHRSALYHFYCAVSKKEGKEVRGISVARSTPWT
jgi:predicted GH43/DUF377 family glycosyl hydrolase